MKTRPEISAKLGQIETEQDAIHATIHASLGPDGDLLPVKSIASTVGVPAWKLYQIAEGVGRKLWLEEAPRLSVLECALLQTIPARFKWGEALMKYGHTFVRTMVGEAVPPRFTEVHGRVLARLVRTGRSGNALPARERRSVRAYKVLGLTPISDDKQVA